jgi:hypothetical protein
MCTLQYVLLKDILINQVLFMDFLNLIVMFYITSDTVKS